MPRRLDSEILTQVGPGTPMGNLMRCYWIPALLSSELKPDGEPLRLKLLGEKLIAFRDTSGRVGIFDHRCPHRCASLFFGRNEEGGLRCVYHGWKFDANGNCLDMPNVPPHQDFRSKVKAKAYRTAERNGLVWVYMGDQSEIPSLPEMEPMLMPAEDMRIFMVQRECNYLQALEGDIDTSHFGFLHTGSIRPEDVDPGEVARYNITDRRPDYHVADTDWGTMYGAHRPAADGMTYWRFAHFLFPFWSMPPDGDFKSHIIVRAWVPMDDEHTMFVHLSWKNNAQGLRTGKDGRVLPGLGMRADADGRPVGGMTMEFLPNTTDWFGRFRLAANAGNDYQIDREAQRQDRIFTGITGIHLQDQAITESMGAISNHAFEHLVASDLMITRTRRRLLTAANALAREGLPPPGVRDPESFLKARGGDFLAPEAETWREAYDNQIRASLDPTGRLIAAE